MESVVSIKEFLSAHRELIEILNNQENILCGFSISKFNEDRGLRE